mgnify:CR=1 FL=1
MNRVILMGRLTRDPEVRYTQGERSMAVARYTLAVDRRGARKSQDGNEQTADFINIVAFDRAGEFAEKYFRQGMRVLVSGRIQTGSYTNKEGQRVYTTDIIADELNVKEVKFADDVESFISYSFKPQLRTVGPKYGKLLNGIRTALSEVDGTAAMKELRDNGVLVLDIAGNRVELAEEDLLIETAQSEGYVTETDGETSVVLDTNLTPELIQEGFVREIISKVQTMRKEAGFEVMDKIIVYAKDNDKIMDIMKANQDEIKREVLAENIVLGEAEGYTKEWNINKEAVTLGVSKVQEEN